MGRPEDHPGEHAPQDLVDIYTSVHDRLADEAKVRTVSASLVQDEINRAKEAGLL